jgi:hypothetical protein
MINGTNQGRLPKKDVEIINIGFKFILIAQRNNPFL